MGVSFWSQRAQKQMKKNHFGYFFLPFPHLSCIPKHHSNIKMTTSTLEITKVRECFLYIDNSLNQCFRKGLKMRKGQLCFYWQRNIT